MKIRKDILQVGSGMLSVDGTKLEAEQQPVRRVLTVDAPVTHGSGPGNGRNVGAIATEIVTENQSAIDVATHRMSLCGNCKWFRNPEWIRDLNNADSPLATIERRRMVNEIRGALLTTRNANLAEMHEGQDGDLDVEAALRQLGYCKALFETFKNMGNSNEDATVLVHPLSCCPDDVRKQMPPHGFYEPKDREAKKVGTANYDRIMSKASGKTP